jgi:hypothetical protein
MTEANPLSASLVIGLCFSPTILAQENVPTPPPDRSGVLLADTGSLLAELSTDKKIAALKTVFSSNEDEYLIHVDVSGPFDEDESEAVVGDLDRFTSMAAIETSYEWLLFDTRQKVALSGRVGGKSFKYVDPADLAKDKKDDHVSYGAGLTWSRFLEGGGILERGALFGARARYERAWEGQPDQQLCVSIDETANLRCRFTGAGAPKKVSAAILQMQIATIPWKAVGVSLLASHDFKSDETGLELPFYLVRDDKTGLFTGGLKLSWRSEEDDLRAILFIGVPIGTF